MDKQFTDLLKMIAISVITPFCIYFFIPNVLDSDVEEFKALDHELTKEEIKTNTRYTNPKDEADKNQEYTH